MLFRSLAQPYASARDLALAASDGSLLQTLSENEYWHGRPQLWTGRVSSLGRLAAGWFAYRERDPRRLWLDETGEPRRVTLALLDAFLAESEALGARRFLVLLLPMREELDAFIADGEAYWSDLPRLLEARGIASLDLAPALAAEQRRCAQDPAQPTLYVAAHLSRVGNSVVAREVLAWLKR